MEDYKITINKSSKNASLERYIIGNDAENLQANLVFVFDEFVNGQARLEYEFDNKKNWIPLEKVGESYKIPIRSVLTKKGMTRMQLVITEGVDVNSIPIFKSNVFVVYCGESLNVIAEAPEGYNEWLEFANTKLNQMDNINVEATKVGNKGIITLTRRDGSQDIIEIYDGEKGEKGDTYTLTDKDRLEIGNIASSNAESTFKKYYDGKVEDFNANATDKTSTFDTNASQKTTNFNSNATNQVEAYNTNANAKISAYNENTIAKTKSFNENFTQKTSDYDLNHTNKLKAYNDNATTQTNSYNTNATQKTTAFNENAQKKTDDFNLIASDYDERINENKKGIARNSKRIENVETALYKKGEASGEFINIQDSALSEVKDIKGSINKAQEVETDSEGHIIKPTPDNPSEIAKQSGVVEITSTGKNLLNCTIKEETINGITITKLPDGKFHLKGKPTNDFNIEYIDEPFTLKAGTYTFDLKNTPNFNLFINTDEGQIILGSNKKSYIHTFEADNIITRMRSWLTTNLNIDVTIQPMIYEGKEETPYEPYQSITEKVDLKENVMLPKDELVRLINPIDNKLWWAINKNIISYTFTGNELEWQDLSIARVQRFRIPVADENNYDAFLISNYFIGAGYTEQPNQIMIFSKWLYLNFELGTFKDINEFKAKLQEWNNNGKPLVVCYEPKDELKETIWLQPVQNFNMTYNPITNIFSNRVNLLLDVSYNRDFVYTIKNLQIDKDTLENQLKDLETRVLALENKPATINESEVIPNEDLRTK